MDKNSIKTILIVILTLIIIVAVVYWSIIFYKEGITPQKFFREMLGAVANLIPSGSGYLGEWKFEDNLNDTSGYQRNGLKHGVTFESSISSQFGKAGRFAGTSYVEVPNFNTGFLKNLTAIGWLNSGDNDWTLFSKSTIAGELKFFLNQGYLYLRIGSFQPISCQIGSDFFKSGTWHLLAITYGAPQIEVYMDGIKKCQGSLGSGTYDLSSTLYIGADKGISSFYDGLLDDFKIYNRTLASTEIQQIYTQGVVSTKKLLAYYSFEGNANDFSGNGNNGTLYGPVLTQGAVGNSYNFDGINDYIKTRSFAIENSGNIITLGFWYKGSLGNLAQSILSDDKREECKNNGKPYIWVYKQLLRNIVIWEYCDGFSNQTDLKTSLDFLSNCSDKWCYVSLIMDYNNKQLKYYLNGGFIGQNTTTNNIKYPFEPSEKFIGGYSNLSPAYFLKGGLDEFKIWNYALTETDINTEYQKGAKKLLAYYSFEGNANDVSGNGNNGVWQGTGVSHWNPGIPQFGTAGKFNGTDDRVKIACSSGANNDNFDLSDFTYSAWIKMDAVPVGWKTIIDIDNDKQFLGLSGSTVGIFGRCGKQFYGNVSTGSWHHIAWSVLGADYKLYLDGQEIGTGSGCNLTPVQCDNGLMIGSGYPGNEYFNGLIDEVKIYSKALSSIEIRQIYTQGVVSGNKLLAYYSFERNANDVSGNGNNGALAGNAEVSRKVLALDGAGDYVDTNFSIGSNKSFTYSAWFNPSSLTSQMEILGDENNQAQGNVKGCSLRYDPTGYRIYAVCADGSKNRQSSYFSLGSSVNVWYQAVLVYDEPNSKLSVYVNGRAGASIQMTGYTANDVLGNWEIGRQHNNLYYFKGLIDEVKVWNYALTGNEIASQYDSGKNPYACADECVVNGEKKCDSNGMNLLTCGNYDSDVCLDLIFSQSCQGNISCGFENCADAEKPVWRCETGGCKYNCVSDSSCVAAPPPSTCADEPGCENHEIPGTKCIGNTKQTCGNYDSDTCFEWPSSDLPSSLGNMVDCGQSNKYCWDEPGYAFCVDNCPTNTANCNNNFSDGCEINLSNDKNNCGSCANVCSANYECRDKQCVPISPPLPPEGILQCSWCNANSSSFGFPKDIKLTLSGTLGNTQFPYYCNNCPGFNGSYNLTYQSQINCSGKIYEYWKSAKFSISGYCSGYEGNDKAFHLKMAKDGSSNCGMVLAFDNINKDPCNLSPDPITWRVKEASNEWCTSGKNWKITAKDADYFYDYNPNIDVCLWPGMSYWDGRSVFNGSVTLEGAGVCIPYCEPAWSEPGYIEGFPAWSEGVPDSCGGKCPINNTTNKCTPNCEGKQCGNDDGCGKSCDSCWNQTNGTLCTPYCSQGACSTSTEKGVCWGKECRADKCTKESDALDPLNTCIFGPETDGVIGNKEPNVELITGDEEETAEPIETGEGLMCKNLNNISYPNPNIYEPCKVCDSAVGMSLNTCPSTKCAGGKCYLSSPYCFAKNGNCQIDTSGGESFSTGPDYCGKAMDIERQKETCGDFVRVYPTKNETPEEELEILTMEYMSDEALSSYAYNGIGNTLAKAGSLPIYVLASYKNTNAINAVLLGNTGVTFTGIDKAFAKLYEFIARKDIIFQTRNLANLEIGKLFLVLAKLENLPENGEMRLFNELIHRSGLDYEMPEIRFKTAITKFQQESITHWSDDRGVTWHSLEEDVWPDYISDPNIYIASPNNETVRYLKEHPMGQIDYILGQCQTRSLDPTTDPAVEKIIRRDCVIQDKAWSISRQEDPESPYNKMMKHYTDAINRFTLVKNSSKNLLSPSDSYGLLQSLFSLSQTYLEIGNFDLAKQQYNSILSYRFANYNGIASQSRIGMAKIDYLKIIFKLDKSSLIDSGLSNVLQNVRIAINLDPNNKEAVEFLRDAKKGIMANIGREYRIVLANAGKHLMERISIFNVGCLAGVSGGEMSAEFTKDTTEMSDIQAGLISLTAIQDYIIDEKDNSLRNFANSTNEGRLKMLSKAFSMPIPDDQELRAYFKLSPLSEIKITDIQNYLNAVKDVSLMKNLADLLKYLVHTKKAVCGVSDVRLMMMDGNINDANSLISKFNCANTDISRYYFKFVTGEDYQYKAVSDTFRNELLTNLTSPLMLVPFGIGVGLKIAGIGLKAATIIRPAVLTTAARFASASRQIGVIRGLGYTASYTARAAACTAPEVSFSVAKALPGLAVRGVKGGLHFVGTQIEFTAISDILRIATLPLGADVSEIVGFIGGFMGAGRGPITSLNLFRGGRVYKNLAFENAIDIQLFKAKLLESGRGRLENILDINGAIVGEAVVIKTKAGEEVRFFPHPDDPSALRIFEGKVYDNQLRLSEVAGLAAPRKSSLQAARQRELPRVVMGENIRQTTNGSNLYFIEAMVENQEARELVLTQMPEMMTDTRREGNYIIMNYVDTDSVSHDFRYYISVEKRITPEGTVVEGAEAPVSKAVDISSVPTGSAAHNHLTFWAEAMSSGYHPSNAKSMPVLNKDTGLYEMGAGENVYSYDRTLFEDVANEILVRSKVSALVTPKSGIMVNPPQCFGYLQNLADWLGTMPELSELEVLSGRTAENLKYNFWFGTGEKFSPVPVDVVKYKEDVWFSFNYSLTDPNMVLRAQRQLAYKKFIRATGPPDASRGMFIFSIESPDIIAMKDKANGIIKVLVRRQGDNSLVVNRLTVAGQIDSIFKAPKPDKLRADLIILRLLGIPVENRNLVVAKASTRKVGSEILKSSDLKSLFLYNLESALQTIPAPSKFKNWFSKHFVSGSQMTGLTELGFDPISAPNNSIKFKKMLRERAKWFQENEELVVKRFKSAFSDVGSYSSEASAKAVASKEVRILRNNIDNLLRNIDHALVILEEWGLTAPARTYRVTSSDELAALGDIVANDYKTGSGATTSPEQQVALDFIADGRGAKVRSGKNMMIQEKDQILTRKVEPAEKIETPVATYTNIGAEMSIFNSDAAQAYSMALSKEYNREIKALEVGYFGGKPSDSVDITAGVNRNRMELFYKTLEYARAKGYNSVIFNTNWQHGRAHRAYLQRNIINQAFNSGFITSKDSAVESITDIVLKKGMGIKNKNALEIEVYGGLKVIKDEAGTELGLKEVLDSSKGLEIEIEATWVNDIDRMMAALEKMFPIE